MGLLALKIHFSVILKQTLRIPSQLHTLWAARNTCVCMWSRLGVWSLGFDLFRVTDKEGCKSQDKDWGRFRVRVRVSLTQTLILTLILGTRKIESQAMNSKPTSHTPSLFSSEHLGVKTDYGHEKYRYYLEITSFYGGGYCFRVARASVRPSVRAYLIPFVILFDACHILWTAHARVLKFLLWILHVKVAHPYCFSCPSYAPFWSYAPLKTLIWIIVCKIFLLIIWATGLKLGQLIGHDE